MKSLMYCKFCGTILSRDTAQQIVHRNFGTKKEKTLCELCSPCLEKIMSRQIPEDKLVLRRTDGKRYWREGDIEAYMNNSTEGLLRSLKKLYEYQTDDEKVNRETKYDNAVGFNKPDSSFLTGMAKKYIAEDCKVDGFTEKQIDTIRNKMQKYVAQLTIIANA